MFGSKGSDFVGFKVVVVDDGSTDGTSEIARYNGAHVIRHYENMGKGASMRDGFGYLRNEKIDADICGFFDKVSTNKQMFITRECM